MNPSLRFACNLFFVAATVLAAAPVGAAVSIPEAPAIESKAYALIDFDSGELLAGNNPDARVEPASITKVLTTYVAFDEIRKGRLKLDDTALISEKAWRQGKDSSESRMFLTLGSRVKIEDLLRGIIIVSGNDASIALAEHLAGSEEAFADLMNDAAKKLGMANSHFVDSSGLPHPDHYTTARDLAILGRALIREFPEHYKMYSERSFKYGIDRPQENRNGLLNKDPSVDGIKTGHTNAAGYCLLTSASRDGRRLISAVMGADSWAYREKASLELLNWGFRFYESASLFGPTAAVGSDVRLVVAKPVFVPVTSTVICLPAVAAPNASPAEAARAIPANYTGPKWISPTAKTSSSPQPVTGINFVSSSPPRRAISTPISSPLCGG